MTPNTDPGDHHNNQSPGKRPSEENSKVPLNDSRGPVPNEAELDLSALRLSPADSVNRPPIALRDSLDQVIALSREGEAAALGKLLLRQDFESSLGSFATLPGYKTQYPAVVVEALGNLYREYNQQFARLIEANREHATDYQYAFDKNGQPLNYFVQIDMVGLPAAFLKLAATRSEPEVRGALRGRIFEIENSLAMYQLLENVFATPGGSSLFQMGFRRALQDIRDTHNMPIALLAVTDAKYLAMKSSEFGKQAHEDLSPADVKRLSGFDALMGPEQFRQHLAENGGECKFLLYVRSSDPVAKLKSPGLSVANPLLGDAELRRIIKAHAITFNVDGPEMTPDQKINDTKGYLTPMGMAFTTSSLEDLIRPEALAFPTANRPMSAFPGRILTDAFSDYLLSQGISPDEVLSGERKLRAKPLQGTYGCYGHVTGEILDGKFRQEFRRGLRERGSYVIQPEMDTPTVSNVESGVNYTYIDRNFMSFTDGQARFLGGFRSLMSVDSVEAKKKRIHGSAETVWAEIF